MQKQRLFLLDVDGVQQYIFSTNKLKTIIGASWLVDHVNCSCTRSIFSDGPNPKIIYTGGGNTLISFSDDPSDHQQQQQQISDLIEKYEQYGISVTTTIADYHPEKHIDSIESIYRKLAQEKYNKTSYSQSAVSPYFKICELCGRDYVELRCDEYHVCSVCSEKYKHADKPLRGFDGYNFLSDPTGWKEMAAIVVMDGNNMSDKIRRLDSLDKISEFSLKTQEVFQESFRECIESLYAEDWNAKNMMSIRPLIMGGDDLCLIIKAKDALRFVQTFIGKVEEKSSQENDLFFPRITLSAGVLFMKPNYPFNFARHIAESLLRSAKKASRERDGCSMIDFHILMSSSGDVIEKTRDREYRYQDQGDDLTLTCKPYSSEDLDKLAQDARMLESCLANNKIKSLRSVLRQGRHESTFEMLKLSLRIPEQSRAKFKELLNRHAWRQVSGDWHNSLLDVIELTNLQ